MFWNQFSTWQQHLLMKSVAPKKNHGFKLFFFNLWNLLNNDQDNFDGCCWSSSSLLTTTCQFVRKKTSNGLVAFEIPKLEEYSRVLLASS
jgi:hypothetical protein